MPSLGPLLGGGTIIYQRSPTLRSYTPGNAKAMQVRRRLTDNITVIDHKGLIATVETPT